jgi:hypothetical protein
VRADDLRLAGCKELHLADVLQARGVDAPSVQAFRLTLHPQDRSTDFRVHADLSREGVVTSYDRMQDGARFGAEARVLTFLAEAKNTARLIGFRRFVARRPGSVPIDLVYDYAAAHLLHAFIARARQPVFYDTFDEAGLDDLFGRLVIAWPQPRVRSKIMAGDRRLTIINGI